MQIGESPTFREIIPCGEIKESRASKFLLYIYYITGMNPHVKKAEKQFNIFLKNSSSRIATHVQNLSLKFYLNSLHRYQKMVGTKRKPQF